jgi:hypothetical protein
LAAGAPVTCGYGHRHHRTMSVPPSGLSPLEGNGARHSPRSSIRLLFLVLIPLLLLEIRFRSYTEPYPGIFLPAGATLLRGDTSFTGFQTECLAEDSSGRKYPFSASEILDAVPSNYRPLVVEAGFGINKNRIVRHIPVPLLGRKFELGRSKSRLQLDSTKVWLRSKVRRVLGIDPIRIHVLTYAITTYYGTGPDRQVRRLQRESIVDLLASNQ